MLSRRHLLALAGAAAVSACSADSSARLAYDTIKAAYQGPEDYPLTPRQIFDIPYSTMGFWAGRNPKAIVVMETLEPPYRAVWRSADKVGLVSENGLIASTAGMPHDLRRFEYSKIPVLDLAIIASLEGRALRGMIDTANPTRFGLPFESRFELGAVTAVTILGVTHRLVPVTEHFSMPTEKWSADNYYWFRRSDGLALKGRRSFSKTAPPLHWERFFDTPQA